MDDNLVASETHQLVPMNYFDLNELPQEGTIFFFLICNPYFIKGRNHIFVPAVASEMENAHVTNSRIKKY